LASAVLEHMLACAFQAKRPTTSREFKWLGANGRRAAGADDEGGQSE
jgi:hypothetical protein